MLGIGVIGYGYWGPNLVRNFDETPGARVIAVSDMRAARLAEVTSRYPMIKTSTDPRDLLADPKVDAVIIATPIPTHFDLAMQALHAGKHVLVEKPLVTNVEQGLRLLDDAARLRRVLMVDHTFIYTGAVRKIRELVANGELGQCYYLDSVRVNLGLFQSGVSVLWDLAVHDVAIIDHVLQVEPVAVSATGVSHVPGEPEDIAYLSLFFEGGVIAHIHVNWLAPVKLRRMLLGGSRKMIVYDDLEPSEKVKVYDKGITVKNGGESARQVLIGYRTGDMWAPQLDMTEALRTEARHFVQCIEKEAMPLSGGDTGLRVVRALEAAAQSMAAHGRPVELDAWRVLV